MNGKYDSANFSVIEPPVYPYHFPLLCVFFSASSAPAVKDLDLRFRGDGENAGRTDNALLADMEVNVAECESAADFLNVGAALDPVAKFGAAGKVSRNVGGHCLDRRIRGRGHGVAQRDVRHGHQCAAVNVTTCIQVMFENPHADSQLRAPTAREVWPGPLQERAAAEQWFESFWYGGGHDVSGSGKVRVCPEVWHTWPNGRPIRQGV